MLPSSVWTLTADPSSEPTKIIDRVEVGLKSVKYGISMNKSLDWACLYVVYDNPSEERYEPKLWLYNLKEDTCEYFDNSRMGVFFEMPVGSSPTYQNSLFAYTDLSTSFIKEIGSPFAEDEQFSIKNA